MQVILIIILFLTLSCQSTDKKLSKVESKQNIVNCVLKTGWYLVNYSGKGCERKILHDTSSYYLQQVPLILSNNVTAIDDVEFMDDIPGFILSFDVEGTKQWQKVTGSHIGDLFAFVLNDTLLTVSANTAKISTGKAFFSLPNRSNAELQRIKQAIMAR